MKSEVGEREKHLAAEGTRTLSREPNAFHQMGEKDLRLFAISGLRVHGRTVHYVAARRIPAVRPVEGPIGKIQVQIDGFRQVFIKRFNVSAVRG
jgi:hypothetical protein